MPDELDPQVREFAGQLRRLVDRSGMSIAAVADRTGYSKTSWERYLNGRLLAPKGAIVALAEVTGTNPIHLTTMWELAERAWSRSEMRHDMTMEAIRISQARAALGETGGQSTVKGVRGGKNGRASRSATATPGVAGPAGVSPTVPPQAQPPGEERRPRPSYGGSSAPSSGPSAAAGGAPRVSWGATPSASAPASSPASYGEPPSSVTPASSASVPGGASAPPGVFGPPQGGAGRPDDGDSSARRRLPMFLAGVVGALVVIAAAFLFTNGDGKDDAADKPTSPQTTAVTNPNLPDGVKCSGKDCDGKDPETMGCIGSLVTTTDAKFVGPTRVEVRYSKTCGAAWARITQAAPGDEVQVTVGKTKQTAAIEEANDTIAYTPMVAVKDAGDATACATLATGQEGCTG
ncbi:DUF2690 domain-containing protein [Streptomyces tailanensis]|uniref:helix-turn-helix domain-containing protein n=1 Tax=Streptomyces tailanensis TaxID=2569858 RepID=UPI00122E856E